MAATYCLESRGQASSAGLKTARHGSHSLPGEQRTGIISRPETQQGMVATHNLESRGQVLSAGLNTARHGSHSLAGEQRTGIISRLETLQGMAATHKLESRGQATSAGLKHSMAWKPLTNWRAEDKHHQQA